MKARVAPNAKIPVRNSRSALYASPVATIAATEIATYGVERVACRRPSRLGTWRFVAREYVSRESPSMVPFTACRSTSAPTPPITYRSVCISQLGWKAETIPSTGASM